MFYKVKSIGIGLVNMVVESFVTTTTRDVQLLIINNVEVDGTLQAGLGS